MDIRDKISDLCREVAKSQIDNMNKIILDKLDELGIEFDTNKEISNPSGNFRCETSPSEVSYFYKDTRIVTFMEVIEPIDYSERELSIKMKQYYY